MVSHSTSSSSSDQYVAQQINNMVDMELAAARALTDLATSAATNFNDNNCDSSEIKLNYNQSPNTVSLVYGDDENEVHTVNEQPLDINDDNSHTSSTKNVTKQKLNESEKEAKKLRRILANRESARQTIRRRQAFREELNRKVQNLSFEKRQIEKEKEMAMKEYFLLKDQNQQLKEQVAKVTDTRTSKETKTNSLVVSDKSSFTPYICPSFSSAPDHNQQRPSLPPCAWYFPFVHEAYGSPPWYSSSAEDKYDSQDNTNVRRVDADDAIGSFSQLTLKLPSFSGPVDDNLCNENLRENEFHGIFPQPSVKMCSAAAEARKRRKELMKLKILLKNKL